MLRLMLLRHAKSDFVPGLPDHERPLTERGYDEGDLMGRYLARQDLQPDAAIVSTATRTRQTWQRVAAELGTQPVHIVHESRIYEAAVGDIVHVVRTMEPGPQVVLLIGHNPGMTLTAQYFCGGDNAAGLARLQEGYPPCALTVIDFAIDQWRDVSQGNGMLDRFVTPEMARRM